MTGAPSLTLRLTLSFAAASTALLLAAGAWLGSHLHAHFAEQDLAEMHGKLELVRHMLARLRTQDELAQVPRLLADAMVGHDRLALAVDLAPQQPLFRTPGAMFPEVLVDAASAHEVRQLEWERGGRAFRGISGSATTAIGGQDRLSVLVTMDIELHRRFVSTLRASLVIALVVGVAASALLGWLAARSGLRPLARMARAVRGVSAGRLDERLPTEWLPAELLELGQAFNQMLGRLQESFERLSHFSSDLAHELRTPIGNLMLQSQVAVSKARSADEYREVLYSSVEECERLSRMIDDMLFLAQADNGMTLPDRVTIDLAAEVQALFGFYEALADEKGVSLALEGRGLVSGDRAMIRRALSNLLANAIRHAPQGASVRTTIAAAGGGTRLCMCNPGHLDAAQLERVFDRFYRADAARTSSAGGAGLGLAITRSIVAAHGGSIRAASTAHEVCFTVDWPPLPGAASG